MKTIVKMVSIVLVLLLVVACAPKATPTPQVITKVETRIVKETQVVVVTPTRGPVQYEWKTGWGTFKLSARIAEKVAKGKKLRFVVSTWDPVAPFFVPVKTGTEDAGRELGCDAVFIGPANPTTEEQMALLETELQKGADGFGIISMEPDIMARFYEKAIGEGVPCMTVNVEVGPTVKTLGYVGQLNYPAGVSAAQLLMKAYLPKFGEKGKIAIGAAFPSAEYFRSGRGKGFQDEMKKYPGIQIVGPFELGVDMDKAYAVVENFMMANPDITAVYIADEFIQPVGDYIERNKLTGKVLAVGHNLEPGILGHIKKGNILVTIGQSPYRQGYDPVKYMYEFITTGKVPSCVPVCDLGAEIVDASNLSKYLTE